MGRRHEQPEGAERANSRIENRTWVPFLLLVSACGSDNRNLRSFRTGNNPEDHPSLSLPVLKLSPISLAEGCPPQMKRAVIRHRHALQRRPLCFQNAVTVGKVIYHKTQTAPAMCSGSQVWLFTGARKLPGSLWPFAGSSPPDTYNDLNFYLRAWSPYMSSN